ncbi:Protein tilB-like [Hondaea fermentalgiana]|uniref:Protein tilB-like n=1 Tax=Hondaea fermentalgiana TaxID=2315210 RepID=A0A2R5GEW5_9STRA|nr:Protein tilB-like [Hondaea fermentalgiana]|eukprot:GBG26374.1 Protein tilB-like [Hondaea fermentalgiana]
MVRIDAELIRRKSEHNEGTMADLEEIALHQLEIEKIEKVGSLCRRLKILYLQNNIIGKLENLQHLKELEYLNVSQNNILKIEGLESCEFLNKLDLMLNFVPCSALEESVANLKHNKLLRELYVVGNPFADWEGHKDYIILRLPHLQKLDGMSITKSDRIRAAQRSDDLDKELAERIAAEAHAKASKPEIVDVSGDNAPYTPELRTEMYREMAEEKAEKEAREKERLPKERNYEKEHEEAVALARAKQFFPDGRVRQCNEGGLDFALEEDRENVYLRVQLPRYVDTSLIDCQVYPRFVEVIFKDKVLRLGFPGGEDRDEVRAEDAKCERSQASGELKVTMPKLTSDEAVTLSAPSAGPLKDRNGKDKAAKLQDSASGRVKRLAQPTKRADDILRQAVDLRTIYQGKENPNLANEMADLGLRASSSAPVAVKEQARREAALHVPALDDDDDDDDE